MSKGVFPIKGCFFQDGGSEDEESSREQQGWWEKGEIMMGDGTKNDGNNKDDGEKVRLKNSWL